MSTNKTTAFGVITVILILLIFAVVAFATSKSYTTSYQPIQVVPVMPLYGATHTPSADLQEAQAPDEALQLLRQIADDLRYLRQAVERAEQGAPGVGDGEAPTSGAALVRNVCARCHDANVADTKGGGFSLTNPDGTIRELDTAQKARVKRRVKNSSMPPPDSGLELTETQSQDLLEFYGG